MNTMTTPETASAEVAKDFLGNEIKVGSTIVYAWRVGSSLGLRRAKVSQVNRTGRSFRLSVYDPDSPTKRSVAFKNIQNAVVVPE